MKLLKELQKTVKAHHVLAALAGIVLIYVFYNYSNKKAGSMDGMKGGRMATSPSQVQQAVQSSGAAQPAAPEGANEQYAPVSGMESTQGLPPSCSAGAVPNPAELLPKDQNSEWARLNPAGNADFNQVNHLKAGHHAGINTVGSSLRNANLQLRSEPPNPTNRVSPWMNTTIEPDLMRVPLEIGCGKQ